MDEQMQKSLPHLDVEAVPIIDPTHEREKRLFEAALEGVPFAGVYLSLVEDGWKWRRAAVIAWYSMPKKSRQPETQAELADLLGCGVSTVKRIAGHESTQVQLMKLTTASLFEHKALVDEALIESATDSNYKNNQDRKTFYQLIGAIRDRHEIELKPGDDAAMRQMSDEELMSLAQLEDGDDAADD